MRRRMKETFVSVDRRLSGNHKSWQRKKLKHFAPSLNLIMDRIRLHVLKSH